MPKKLKTTYQDNYTWNMEDPVKIREQGELRQKQRLDVSEDSSYLSSSSTMSSYESDDSRTWRIVHTTTKRRISRKVCRRVRNRRYLSTMLVCMSSSSDGSSDSSDNLYEPLTSSDSHSSDDSEDSENDISPLATTTSNSSADEPFSDYSSRISASSSSSSYSSSFCSSTYNAVTTTEVASDSSYNCSVYDSPELKLIQTSAVDSISSDDNLR